VQAEFACDVAEGLRNPSDSRKTAELKIHLSVVATDVEWVAKMAEMSFYCLDVFHCWFYARHVSHDQDKDGWQIPLAKLERPH
jgi:hypothetical protein